MFTVFLILPGKKEREKITKVRTRIFPLSLNLER